MKTKQLKKLHAQLETLIFFLEESQRAYRKKIKKTHPSHTESTKNLVHYLALRKIDLAKTQGKLEILGLSRLARSESYVLDGLRKSREHVSALLEKEKVNLNFEIPSAKNRLKLHHNTTDLLGDIDSKRRVGIMVTMPSESVTNPKIISAFMQQGMDVARVNCAHDTSAEWKAIIDQIKSLEDKFDKKVTISMDLAGPKVRTGAMTPGPAVRKIKPMRDVYGNIKIPATVRLTEAPMAHNDIPVPTKWIKKLQIGDTVKLWDARGKKRRFIVTEYHGDHAVIQGMQTTYFETGLRLQSHGQVTQILNLPNLETAIHLQSGDLLVLHKEQIWGKTARLHESGQPIPAQISCTSPVPFKHVRIQDRVFFDDGKIEGRVIRASSKKMIIKIETTKIGGVKLKTDKGINFPDTDLPLVGLTKKDRQDLDFITDHAHVINFSFVNSAQDVKELQQILREKGVLQNIGVVLKIETKTAFNNLGDILLEAMKMKKVGIMIARGDLAIEVGWDKIGWVQQEILSICAAAHVPVIWATQVFENYAKNGLPSRSEISDVTMALKAECVMLNKGPHISGAIKLLDQMLGGMEKYQSKSHKMMPSLKKLPKSNR
ncbi:pyruvate kinase [Sediminicola luteus]|uniref:pyruvate kinase n=1 Tax=Sediminicola luteus TaxID=319238 RepID=A0A2A4G9Q8_9FLAO|nr:pyruvate kinase [Sediminicola luteus]PCE64708.1 hypothetical protein B7P33_05925 [Sediminicola luteus]